MAQSKWMSILDKHEGLVNKNQNPLIRVIRCGSPSTNFIFANTHGLPRGYTVILSGPPKGGKTLLCNSFIAQLHKDDPEAIVLKFDTELRESIQCTTAVMEAWGIDPERYKAYSTNDPDLIFNFINNEVKAAIQEGAKIALIIIDSINGIQGRQAIENDDMMKMRMGDEAKTQGDGLKHILPLIRKHGISLILTTQIRSEFDQLEQRRNHSKTKMAAAFALKHFGEYFVNVEPDYTLEGRKTLEGIELINPELKDLDNKEEKTGHRIFVTMENSSLGCKGRSGCFTVDYARGIINTHEEVYLLGVNRKVIRKVGLKTYFFVLPDGTEKKWTSKGDLLNSIRTDKALYDEIIKRVMQIDIDFMNRKITDTQNLDVRREIELEEEVEGEGLDEHSVK